MLYFDDLLGKEYEPGGRGPDTFDCYGLCLEMARRAGINIPVLLTPDSLPATHNEYLRQQANMVKVDAPKSMCIVAFRVAPPFVTHMGFVLDDARTFIHIMRKRRVAVERLDSLIWRHRIDGYYETRSR